ncbi:MAG: 50S ribosomal protein L4 [Bdellovibrionaceae bacterium]|nr:50S ribosomal protein L4 [Pseudobdellovibrionaceae bacterium]
MSTTVYNWKKEKVGSIDLDPTIFGITPRVEILHEVVRWQLASRRQGTHMVKTRSLVSGGGKKPFKQKGTGNARQGSTRSPLMPGGAKLFGPVPRDYSWALPKKVRKLALRMALSQLNQAGKLFIVDDMKSDGKTNALAKQLKAFGLEKSVLVDAGNEQASRAARNLAKYKFLAIDGVNVFDLLKYDAAVLTKSSVAELSKRLQAEG